MKTIKWPGLWCTVVLVGAGVAGWGLARYSYNTQEAFSGTPSFLSNEGVVLLPVALAGTIIWVVGLCVLARRVARARGWWATIAISVPMALGALVFLIPSFWFNGSDNYGYSTPGLISQYYTIQQLFDPLILGTILIVWASARAARIIRKTGPLEPSVAPAHSEHPTVVS
jgi:hypothetical protein